MLLSVSLSQFLYLEHGALTVKDVFIRIAFSAVVGLLIGYNRQIKFQSAGLRTFTLITLGSTTAMLVSIYIPTVTGLGDTTRIAAQVLSGVGFIGAGAIIRGRGDNVQGLTTAAGIWACSALGLAIGAGMYITAFLISVLILFTLVVLGNMEDRMGLTHKSVDIEIHTNDPLPDIDVIKDNLLKLNVIISGLTIDSHFIDNTGVINIKARFRNNKINYKLNKELSKLDFVTDIKTDF